MWVHDKVYWFMLFVLSQYSRSLVLTSLCWCFRVQGQTAPDATMPHLRGNKWAVKLGLLPDDTCALACLWGPGLQCDLWRARIVSFGHVWLKGNNIVKWNLTNKYKRLVHSHTCLWPLVLYCVCGVRVFLRKDEYMFFVLMQACWCKQWMWDVNIWTWSSSCGAWVNIVQEKLHSFS